jgi:hypothetical protein
MSARFCVSGHPKDTPNMADKDLFLSLLSRHPWFDVCVLKTRAILCIVNVWGDFPQVLGGKVAFS